MEVEVIMMMKHKLICAIIGIKLLILAVLLSDNVFAYKLVFQSHQISQEQYTKLLNEMDTTKSLDSIGIKKIVVRDYADKNADCGLAYWGSGLIIINDKAIRKDYCPTREYVLKHEACHQEQFNVVKSCSKYDHYCHEVYADMCAKAWPTDDGKYFEPLTEENKWKIGTLRKRNFVPKIPDKYDDFC